MTDVAAQLRACLDELDGVGASDEDLEHLNRMHGRARRLLEALDSDISANTAATPDQPSQADTLRARAVDVFGGVAGRLGAENIDQGPRS